MGVRSKLKQVSKVLKGTSSTDHTEIVDEYPSLISFNISDLSNHIIANAPIAHSIVIHRLRSQRQLEDIGTRESFTIALERRRYPKTSTFRYVASLVLEDVSDPRILSQGFSEISFELCLKDLFVKVAEKVTEGMANMNKDTENDPLINIM